MKTINTKRKIFDLRGQPYKNKDSEWTYGEYLSEIVLALKDEGTMKKLLIAKKLIEDVEEVSFDTSDFAIIKKAVEEGKFFNENTHNALNTIFNGQILEYFEELKEIKKDRK